MNFGPVKLKTDFWFVVLYHECAWFQFYPAMKFVSRRSSTGTNLDREQGIIVTHIVFS